MANATSVAVEPQRAALGLWNIALGAGVALGLAGIALANGSYFPTAWGWGALIALWLVATYLIVVAAARPSGLGAAMLVSLAALAGWIWLSTLWSQDSAQSVLEGQRAILYVAATSAFLIFARRTSVPFLLGGTLVAVVLAAGYGLATRLFPDRLGVFDPVATYRLEEPLGYWNALGIFAAMGTLLALGFAARGRPLPRALAGAAAVVLLPTIYFTFSRGAWLALAAGAVAAVALDPRRLQLLVSAFAVAPAGGLAVWLASRSDALTTMSAPLSAASREGHRLALWILLLAAFTAVAVLGLAYAERRVAPPRSARLAFAGALVVVAAAGALTVFVRYGDPITLADRAYDAFVSPPPPTEADLRKRLLSFSGTYRVDLWKAGWHEYRSHSALGSGAGSYERYWLRHRPFAHKVRDAHSLYIESLGELGPLGLLLLLGALVPPLIAAVRARAHLLVPAALGAYVAFLVHAGVDWDWEMPAVTITALACGVALVAAGSNEIRRPLSLRLRLGGVAAALLVGAVALVGLVGASAVDTSQTALEKGRFGEARSEARKASHWWRWSPEPWERLGDALAAEGRRAEARASYRKAIAKDRRDWVLWLDLAEVSDASAARRAVAEAAKLNPRSPEVADLRSQLGEGGNAPA